MGLAPRDTIRLIEDYRDCLMLLVRSPLGARLRAKVDGSDVVQQTILHAYETRGQYRGETEGKRLAAATRWSRSPAGPGCSAGTPRRHLSVSRLGVECDLKSRT
jgi:hypothetical protein